MPVRRKLTKSVVDRLEPGAIIWDSEVRGFAARKQRQKPVFILRFSRQGRLHMITIGPLGAPWTVETARDRAKQLLADITSGHDPAAERRRLKKAPTLATFAKRYLTEVSDVRKKASTAKEDARLVRLHISSGSETDKELAETRVAEVNRAQIAKWHSAKRSKPVAANRALALLSHMMNYAIEVGERAEGVNPCTKIKKFPEQPKERYLSAAELGRLGAAIAEAEGPGIPWQPDPARKTKHAPKVENRMPAKVDKYTAGALRLLLFTGARLREILHLKWANVDFERGLLFLDDSKTGRKTIVLNAPALSVLNALPREGVYVFPGDTKSTPKRYRQNKAEEQPRPRNNLTHAWTTIRRRAGIEDVRLHDLRHTFASVGAGSGMGLPIVGKLLGHSQHSTTARYAHLEADPVRRASDAIGHKISAALGGRAPASVSKLRS